MRIETSRFARCSKPFRVHCQQRFICLTVDVLLQAWLTEPVRNLLSMKRLGSSLFRKQELMQRTGGHALAMFADSKHQCQFFATEALQPVATDREAIQLASSLCRICILTSLSFPDA